MNPKSILTLMTAGASLSLLSGCQTAQSPKSTPNTNQSATGWEITNADVIKFNGEIAAIRNPSSGQWETYNGWEPDGTDAETGLEKFKKGGDIILEWAREWLPILIFLFGSIDFDHNGDAYAYNIDSRSVVDGQDIVDLIGMPAFDENNVTDVDCPGAWLYA